MRNRSLIAVILDGLLSMLTTPLLFWGWVLLTKFIYVIVGLIFGWITGWFFADTILGILAQIGITGFSMWQIGAFLGFVGSFFGNVTYFDPRKKNEPQNQNYNYNPYRGMY